MTHLLMTHLPELAVVLVLVLILFGGAKLPQLARSLGQAQNEFLKGQREGLKDQEGPENKNEDTL